MNLNKAKCVPIQRGLPNAVWVEPKSANRRFHRDALRIYAVEQSLVEAPRNRAAPNKRNTEPHTLFIREGNYLDGQRQLQLSCNLNPFERHHHAQTPADSPAFWNGIGFGTHKR